jgi:hypothetical protein
MNIQYTIDSNTGLMRLQFKKNILNTLEGDRKDIFEKYILPMLAMNDKFCLTGSLSLKLLGFEVLDKIGDFDFGLMGEFTEDEYNTIKNFFQLNNSNEGYTFDDNNKKIDKFNPKAHLWQLSKGWNEDISIGDDLQRWCHFKLDIFNDEFIRKKDIIEVYYDDFPIKLVHPSITLSYRMRYALDTRSSTTFKYWEKMKSFMDNAKSYYQNIRVISKMYARIHEHNTNVEGNESKIQYIRALIDRRNYNMDEFYKKVFDETISPFNLMIEKEQEQFKQNLTNAK